MSKFPDLLNVVAAAPNDPLSEAFANREIYNECLSILRQMVLAQAADRHPSWERSVNGTHKHRGRTGPKTPETLAAWFEQTHPESVEKLAEAIRRAVHVKHGIKPPKAS